LLVLPAAPAGAAFLLEIDTDGADDNVLTYNPAFSFGEDTTTAAASVTSPAFGTTGGGSAPLDAWIDFNADGDWDDAGEQIFDGAPLVAGANALQFNVPCVLQTTSSYARFRISSDGKIQ
jgi:hypothetical protein